jgi:hypothetical protein
MESYGTGILPTTLVTPPTEGGYVFVASSESGCLPLTIKQIFSVPYNPHPEDFSFLSRSQIESKDDVIVRVAVLSSKESKHIFGRPLYRRGIQPVWIEVTNRRSGPLLLDRVRLDPNYFPPLEAAMISHFGNLLSLVAQGGVLWFIFLPLLFVIPFKFFAARKANKQMCEYYCAQNFPSGFIKPGETVRGFVFCSIDDGTKIVNIYLLGSNEVHNFSFSVRVPGITIDFEGKSNFLTLYEPDNEVNCPDLLTLKRQLENQPRATTNAKGTRDGDPVNLVIVSEFKTILAAFGADWNVTEVISLRSCIKTAKSFILDEPYRYCPVSALYMFGRSQDFALQRSRGSISQRLHLRLWMTPLRFEGKPVWVGQISRDIGVKMALTWNLTTHKVDPDVDEARDYLMLILLESGYLDRAGLVGGVGVSTEEDPRKNLGNDPYVTDGNRAVAILSPTKTQASICNWNAN